MAYIGLDPVEQLLNTSTETFSGNAAALQFTLSRSVASASDLDIIVGNVPQRPDIDYSAGNTTLLFTDPPASGTNNIVVTFRGGALNSLDLTATVFNAGTVGAPSVYSLAANNTGIYWANASTMVMTVAGANRATFNGAAASTSNVTGALTVTGGIGATGNINTSGTLRTTDTTESTSITSGALRVGGGAGIIGNLNVGGDITCVGDFTVNGTFTTTGTDSLEVNDPFIFLANANPGDTFDIGVVGQYNDGTDRYTGFFRDITDDKYKIFSNLTVRPTTVVDTGDASFRYEDLVIGNVSATGNVEGTYFLGNGSLLTGIGLNPSEILNGNSNVTIPSVNGNINVFVNANPIANVWSGGLSVVGAVAASTTVTATGNITGGNITTAGLVSATGNVDAGANVNAGNAVLTGLLAATGNITGGNVNTAGLVTAGGNVTGGNLLTSGLASVAGNITGGNVITGGAISATGLLSAGGNVTGANIITGGLITATANITGGNIITAGAISGASVSVSGNVTGGNLATGGIITAVGNITGSYIFGNGSQLTGIDATSIQNGTSNVRAFLDANVAISVAGTSNVAVFIATGVNITGTVSASGNVTGGNVITAGDVSAGGLISVTGNITGGNVQTVGLVTATGNVTGGNVRTAGIVSATGNVTGGNVITGGAVSATGAISATANVVGGNIETTGLVAAGQSVSATGNVTGGNVNTAGLVSATGNITSAGNVAGGNVIATQRVLAANVAATANISATGNVTASTFLGTSLSLSGNIISQIATTSNITGGNINSTGVVSAVGNIVTGTANVSGGNIIASTLMLGTTVSAAGNVVGGNISTGGLITATGNVTGGNINTGGLISATGNIIGGNLIQGSTRVYKWTTANAAPANAVAGDEWYDSDNDKLYKYINDGDSSQWVDQSNPTTFDTLAVNGTLTISGNLVSTGANISVTTGNITAGNINNGGANGVGNIGSASNYFNTVFATATSALYADLAEIYTSDHQYPAGTVVVFGGLAEVTVSGISHDSRVAGVVSTRPAHLMNAGGQGVPVALTGRVPCRARGPITKGDLLVNIAHGVAGRLDPNFASMGCVIGKALTNLVDGDEGMIEISVGRF